MELSVKFVQIMIAFHVNKTRIFVQNAIMVILLIPREFVIHAIIKDFAIFVIIKENVQYVKRDFILIRPKISAYLVMIL